MRTTHRSAARRRNFAPAVTLTLLGPGVTLPPAALAQGGTDTLALRWRASFRSAWDSAAQQSLRS